MIKGVGVDLLEIARIQRVYALYPTRFVERILTEKERMELGKRKNKINFLAKQFAAKEAVAKCFGTGIGRLSFQDIEVLRSDLGAPIVKILNSADKRFQKGSLHLSLSDTKNHVIAFVTYELA